MSEARGFDDLFNPLAVWLGVGRGPRGPNRKAPASTSEMRSRTSFAYGMEDCAVRHSQRSLAASCSRRPQAPASLTSQRGRTSFKEKGAVVEGFGSFVEQHQPSLAPPRSAPRRGPSQPASVTGMRQFTAAFEGGI